MNFISIVFYEEFIDGHVDFLKPYVFVWRLLHHIPITIRRENNIEKHRLIMAVYLKAFCVVNR